MPLVFSVLSTSSCFLSLKLNPSSSASYTYDSTGGWPVRFKCEGALDQLALKDCMGLVQCAVANIGQVDSSVIMPSIQAKSYEGEIVGILSVDVYRRCLNCFSN